MIEKTGQVILTSDDLVQYQKGVVSDRIKNSWDFSLDQLKNIVENHEYRIVDSESNE
jgi:hypothetical protein